MPADTKAADQSTQRFPVSVMMERLPATSPWIEYVWKAIGITVGAHGEERTMLPVRDDGHAALFLFGGLHVQLHVDECESYYHNMVCGTPRAYVVAHQENADDAPKPFLVSMSFDEAHAYLEREDEIYDVDVPPELYRWTEAFVIENYFPEKKTKRKLRDWSADDRGGNA